jgi:hypothetical protein
MILTLPVFGIGEITCPLKSVDNRRLESPFEITDVQHTTSAATANAERGAMVRFLFVRAIFVVIL